MAAEEAGAVRRAPVCLCVLCGLPAAGKSTLAREVLGTAAQHGWRACVVPYDDLIPEHAFQTGVVEDGVRLQESVKTFQLNWQMIFCACRIESSISHRLVLCHLMTCCEPSPHQY